LDKKTTLGTTFILFLISSWLIGIMMNFQYDASARAVDLSYLWVMIALIPFAITGIIFYRGRTRMFLFLFSFALFWIIVPVFFQAFAVLYFSIFFLATILMILAMMKGYINSKKLALITGIFLWLGGFLFYVYMDVYGRFLRSPMDSWPLKSEELVEGPSYIWDEVGAMSESIGGPGILLLAMISISALGFFMYQRFGKYLFFSRSKTETEKVERDITSTVDKAITELHQGKDTESTILRCYQRMCLILEEKGVENEDSMTPREFEGVAIKKLRVQRSRISKIREIFELAKYSSHQLDEEDKNRILQEFKALKEELK